MSGSCHCSEPLSFAPPPEKVFCLLSRLAHALGLGQGCSPRPTGSVARRGPDRGLPGSGQPPSSLRTPSCLRIAGCRQALDKSSLKSARDFRGNGRFPRWHDQSRFPDLIAPSDRSNSCLLIPTSQPAVARDPTTFDPFRLPNGIFANQN